MSADDVAAAIRERLRGDAEAGLIRVEGRDVRFVGLEDGADRVKTLGRWEVEIAVRAEATFRGPMPDPVRKIVEVIAPE